MSRERILTALPAWRRALRRRRRTLALLLVAALIALVAPSLAPASARTLEVVVAGRDLVPGTVLEAADLRTVDVAADLAPTAGHGDPDELVGRALRTRVPSGSPVLAADVSGGPAASPDPGQAAVVVPVDRVLVSRLESGTAVDVVFSTADPAAPRRVRAHVLSVDMSAGGGGDRDPMSSDAPVPVVVSVGRADAPDIAFATHEGWVWVAILG